MLIDEFRGDIGISHLLKWCDKYKCSVENKGGGIPLAATRIIITSNLAPQDWWKDIDPATLEAFLRRVTVIHYQNPFNVNINQ